MARLIQQLAKLPGIGERTATRLAFHILRGPELYAQQLAETLLEVRSHRSPPRDVAPQQLDLPGGNPDRIGVPPALGR